MVHYRRDLDISVITPSTADGPIYLNHIKPIKILKRDTLAHLNIMREISRHCPSYILPLLKCKVDSYTDTILTTVCIKEFFQEIAQGQVIVLSILCKSEMKGSIQP